jgi:selenide,water dikinase
LTNRGLRDGDLLILSKPLGLGIITTAIKFDRADDASAAAAVATMVRTNEAAAEAALGAGATGATDVTGFGLLGHGAQIAQQSGVDLELWAESVPVIAGARELAEAGAVPGGTGRNRAWVEPRLISTDVDDTTITILADAQTSGGLLFGAAPDQANAAVDSLRDSGHDAAIVGVCRVGSGQITVRARR